MRALKPSVRRAEKWSSPLWMWPCVTGAVALVAGLVSVRTSLPSELNFFAWPGTADGAIALLQTIAASVITVTALTFTLTLVALQLASQQFSPRLLRTFSRDPVIKASLAILVGTLIFSVTVMSYVDDGTDMPHLALLITQGLGVASVGTVLGFIAHLVRSLRIDTMMRAVHEEAGHAITTFYPRYEEPDPTSSALDFTPPGEPAVLSAPKSGFVRIVDARRLVQLAQRRDLYVRVDVRPGDHVVLGSPLATCWGGDGTAAPTVAVGVVIGYERTIEQDAAYGFRQLTDIAVKAISPGINDPVTAAHAVGHMAELLVQLLGRRLGATVHRDSDGVGRVFVPDRDLRYYLDLVCGPVRRYGRSDPTVLIALLRMLRDAAAAAQDDEQRSEIARQADLIRAEISEALAKTDIAQVQDMTDRVHAALSGEVEAAYTDRAGEYRSI